MPPVLNTPPKLIHLVSAVITILAVGLVPAIAVAVRANDDHAKVERLEQSVNEIRLQLADMGGDMKAVRARLGIPKD